MPDDGDGGEQSNGSVPPAAERPAVAPAATVIIMVLVFAAFIPAPDITTNLGPSCESAVR